MQNARVRSVCVRGFLQMPHWQLPAFVFVQDHFCVQTARAGERGGVTEDMIDGRGREDSAAFGHSADDVYRRAEPGQEEEGFRFDRPLPAAQEIFANGFAQFLGDVAIAEDAVLQALAEGGEDGRGGGEVGVGDPRGDYAAAVFAPFVGVGALARRGGIKSRHSPILIVEWRFMPRAAAVDVVLLAAGRGERMRSRIAKPLVPLAGKAMFLHALDAVFALRPRRVVVVVSPGQGTVDGGQPSPQASILKAAREYAGRKKYPPSAVLAAEQARPRGTGDAAECGLRKLSVGKSGGDGCALVLCADSPLVTVASLRRLAAKGGDSLALLSARMGTVDDAKGYGRIARDGGTVGGTVCAIVEERDADAATRAVTEIFAGALAAPLGWLRKAVAGVRANNAARERYLTDIAAAASRAGFAVTVVRAGAEEALGVNSPQDWAKAAAVLRRRGTEGLMRRGARLADPLRVDIRGEVGGGADCEIDANVVFAGTVRLGRGCVVGANCFVADAVIGAGARIEPFCHIESARIGRGCVVGPFARLRPGAVLAEGARAGNFVEIKNATLGAGARAGHLAYIGDASIGRGANIGAGVVTCNFDGARKHETVVGAGAFIGSGVELVAPVTVGKGAYVAAGSTVTRDAPGGMLTVARCRQQARRLRRKR